MRHPLTSDYRQWSLRKSQCRLKLRKIPTALKESPDTDESGLLTTKALAYLDSKVPDRPVVITGQAWGDVPNGCDRAGAKDYAAFLGFFFLEPS
jgi:hypothetical protein